MLLLEAIPEGALTSNCIAPSSHFITTSGKLESEPPLPPVVLLYIRPWYNLFRLCQSIGLGTTD